MEFDNLEHLRFENQKTNFPKHFHETFCVSLIESGIEQIYFENQNLFSEKGSISITNPNEVHSNPLLDSNINLTFDTLYLSNDLVKYFNQGKNIRFINKKINSKCANIAFINLKYAIQARDSKKIAFFLNQLIKSLSKFSNLYDEIYTEKSLTDFNEIVHYINSTIEEKFCLDELSKMVNINKYGFIKKFKSSTGMTPINYILMKKIFSCKNLIDSNTELTELAYKYNFSDLAHFSKTFKHFIGISPKMYQNKKFKF